MIYQDILVLYKVYDYIPYIYVYSFYLAHTEDELYTTCERSTVRRRFTQGNCKEKFWVIYTNRRVVHESHSDLLSICNPQ